MVVYTCQILVDSYISFNVYLSLPLAVRGMHWNQIIKNCARPHLPFLGVSFGSVFRFSGDVQLSVLKILNPNSCQCPIQLFLNGGGISLWEPNINNNLSIDSRQVKLTFKMGFLCKEGKHVQHIVLPLTSSACSLAGIQQSRQKSI